MFTEHHRQQAMWILDACVDRKIKLATAESCTGGLLSAIFTEIPGSSAAFERGYVTYSDESKSELLGIPRKLVAVQGAVSELVAAAMAQGALNMAQAGVAAAITGVAGPSGGSAEKPVGTVYIAVATKKGVKVERNLFTGNRGQIRITSVGVALDMLKKSFS